MKGVVFNLFERATTAEHGEEVWDDLLADAELDGAYTSLGSYPDGDLTRLVEAASASFGMAPDDVVRWLGRASIPMLATSYPKLFEPHRTTRDFVLTLNAIIHPEVRKLYPGADVPDFAMVDGEDGRLKMRYTSRRRMCAFAEGLIQGAADHYGETAAIDHPRCMNRGDEACDLEIAFS